MWLTRRLLCWSCSRVRSAERHREDKVFRSHLMNKSTQKERKTLLYNKAFSEWYFKWQYFKQVTPMFTLTCVNTQARAVLSGAASLCFKDTAFLWPTAGPGQLRTEWVYRCRLPNSSFSLSASGHILFILLKFHAFSLSLYYGDLSSAFFDVTNTAGWKLGWWLACFIIKLFFN